MLRTALARIFDQSVKAINDFQNNSIMYHDIKMIAEKGNQRYEKYCKQPTGGVNYETNRVI